MQVVVAGGCDYYPGSASASPSFSFAVSDLRVAGEGDLLARIERLRKALAAEGLLERQRRLPRPLLPRTIGVVTGEGGKARDDILAGLRRRGWAGTIVWGFAPVQDRHAAPAITRALQDLAAVGGVDVAIVARGGGSLADLLCFCDETLCRTVALLGVPVIASVGHHTDRTLLDDVAAVSCSTPTHAAEEAVGVDCAQARAELGRAASACTATAAARCWSGRARWRRSRARPPNSWSASARGCTSSCARSAPARRRRVEGERALTRRRAVVLERKTQAAVGDCRRRRPRELERLALALAAHDPQRTLERGYALVQSPAGEPLSSAARAREQAQVRLRFADGDVGARIEERRDARPEVEQSYGRAQTTRRRGPRRGDHPPAGLGRGEPHRYAGAGEGGQGADRALRAASWRPWAAPWRSCAWRSWSRGWRPMGRRKGRRAGGRDPSPPSEGEPTSEPCG